MVRALLRRRFLAPAGQKILRVSGAFGVKILEKSRCARLWTHLVTNRIGSRRMAVEGGSPPPFGWIFRDVTDICNGYTPLRNGAWRRGAVQETLRNGAWPYKSCFLNARV